MASFLTSSSPARLQTSTSTMDLPRPTVSCALPIEICATVLAIRLHFRDFPWFSEGLGASDVICSFAYNCTFICKKRTGCVSSSEAAGRRQQACPLSSSRCSPHCFYVHTDAVPKLYNGRGNPAFVHDKYSKTTSSNVLFYSTNSPNT